MYSPAESRFIKANRITIIFLILVIVAGGVVRSTGSGMGCPDWPKCFNRVIPPTDISQLPDGYEQQYIDGRVKKNQRFAATVERLGFKREADEIRHDESILVHEEFNAAKTWTEYINRLVGVIVGFCLLFTAVFSLTYRKVKPAITVWSMLNVFLVIFQAWMGSIVVSTNLMPWIITVHMVLALVIVAVSIYTFYLATTLRNKSILAKRTFIAIQLFSTFSLIVLFVQIIFGTGVRELVDMLKSDGVERMQWIESMDSTYDTHRVLGYVTMVLAIVLFVWVKRSFSVGSLQRRFGLFVLVLATLQMVSGIFLARYAVPPYAQTTHLVLASLFFGAHFYLVLLMNKAKGSL